MSRVTRQSRSRRISRAMVRNETLEPRRLFAAVHWDGGGNGADWSDPNNWSTNQVPGPADDVTLNVSASPIVYIRNGTVANVRSVTSTEAIIVEGSGSRLQVAASSRTEELFFMRGNAELRTGNLFQVWGSRAELVLDWSTVSGGGAVAVGGGATFDLINHVTLNNVALINNVQWEWNNGDISLVNSIIWNHGTLNVAHPFASTFNERLVGRGGDTSFQNYGTVNVPAGATLALVNEGSDARILTAADDAINVAGTLSLNAGGTHIGRMTVEHGGTITVRGNHDFRPSSVVNGGGKFVLAGPTGFFMDGAVNPGTLTVDGPVIAAFNTPVTASRFELIGSRANFAHGSTFGSGLIRNGFAAAQFEGAGDVTFTGNLEWQSGTINRGGRTVVAPTGILELNGAGTKLLASTLDCNGPTAWRGGTVQLNGTINNRNYFSISTEAGAVAMTNPSGTGAFNNFALLEKSLGAHDATIGVYVNGGATGDIEALVGTFKLTAGGTHRSVSNLSGSTIAIAGNHTFAANAFDYLRGHFRVEGGTSSFAGNMTAAETVTFAGGTFTLGGLAPRLVYFDGGTGVLNASQSIRGGAMTAGQWLGSGNVKIDSLFTWSGGTIGGTGRFITASDGVLEIDGNAHTLAREMSLDGFTNWMGGDVHLNGGSIRANGLLAILNDTGVMRMTRAAGPANPLVAAGSIVKQKPGAVEFEFPLNNTTQVTIEGGRLALAQGGVHSGDFYVGLNSTLDVGGGHNFGADSTVTGRGVFRLSGAIVNSSASQTFDGEVFVSAGSSLTLSGNRTQIREFTLSGLASIAPGGSRVLSVRTLDVKPNAMLDIADNTVVVDYSGPSPIETIRTALRSGYANGLWNGTGIRSSAMQTGMAIGYAEATDLFSSFPASFAGESIDATAVVMRRALKGDVNLDGRVNLLDFNRLAGAFGSASSTWSGGDCNYDAATNLSDFNALAANFGRTVI